MNDKPKIKVIKKDAQVAPPQPAPEPKKKRETARDVVSTVTSWVSDFQARKREETKLAIEKFLVNKPSPTEA
jgi:hypothetical protein